ncbi:hypothetical protein [Flavivirga sp. 57AJ16]|uniref:hypothetical protein n=1 Tax=Flavivirga sp. 57AJ16 TaxID=3025307 RepID=UPI002365FABB|nr:hypothetical protein [Flavivirga sp. 57AJ16]MDD7888132.1 hypothetical protein [Flavivirga sp. 57AJ16]
MELIHKNDYGVCYKIDKYCHPRFDVQLVINSIGIYMSEAELHNLLKIVRDSDKPCFCDECAGEKCNKIWCTNPLIDICLKMDEYKLELIEDLILRALFFLEMNSTLVQLHIGYK